MTASECSKSPSILLMVAGAKGAVASTLAVSVAAMQLNPETVLPRMTTGNKFQYLGHAQAIRMVGWDKLDRSLLDCIQQNRIIPEHIWKTYADNINEIPVWDAPSSILSLRRQVKKLRQDIQNFRDQFPSAIAVMINLLPSGNHMDLNDCERLSQLYSKVDPVNFPDLSYALAAILSEVPVVNFTSNELEIAPVLHEAGLKI